MTVPEIHNGRLYTMQICRFRDRRSNFCDGGSFSAHTLRFVGQSLHTVPGIWNMLFILVSKYVLVILHNILNVQKLKILIPYVKFSPLNINITLK